MGHCCWQSIKQHRLNTQIERENTHTHTHTHTTVHIRTHAYTHTWLSDLLSEDVLLVEFMYLVFTCMPGVSYCRRLMSLLLCLCDVFWALVNSLVCWFIRFSFCVKQKTVPLQQLAYRTKNLVQTTIQSQNTLWTALHCTKKLLFWLTVSVGLDDSVHVIQSSLDQLLRHDTWYVHLYRHNTNKETIRTLPAHSIPTWTLTGRGNEW